MHVPSSFQSYIFHLHCTVVLSHTKNENVMLQVSHNINFKKTKNLGSYAEYFFFLSKVTEFRNLLFLFFKHLDVLAKYQTQYVHTVYWLRILSFNLQHSLS